MLNYVKMHNIIWEKKGDKAMPMTPKEMGKLLKKNGYTSVVEGGNHTKYTNPKTKVTVVVPRHKKELGKGLERTILKEAGLK